MLKKLASLIKKKRSHPALILMYHRINEEGMDPWSLCVTPRNFEEQLSVIKQIANPISLKLLTEEMKLGKIPYHSVAITFDDGYVDNLHYAIPLLRKYNIPATFFITSGKIGGSKEFWWDELEQILLKPGTLPSELNLQIGGKIYNWKLEKASYYNPDEYKKDFKLKTWDSMKGTRHHLYHSVWKVLHPLAEPEINKIIKEFAQWANVEIKVRHTHRVLTESELRELGNYELAELGAHSITHPPLPFQTNAKQKEEIEGSKKFLEKVLNYPIKSFAYPHGEYTEETLKIVNSLGFEYACSTNETPINLRQSFFELPRIHIEDYNGESFSNILDNAFGNKKI